jgi:hypothetical protein
MSERYIGWVSGTRIRYGIEAAPSLKYFFPACK